MLVYICKMYYIHTYIHTLVRNYYLGEHGTWTSLITILRLKILFLNYIMMGREDPQLWSWHDKGQGQVKKSRVKESMRVWSIIDESWWGEDPQLWSWHDKGQGQVKESKSQRSKSQWENGQSYMWVIHRSSFFLFVSF